MELLEGEKGDSVEIRRVKRRLRKAVYRRTLEFDRRQELFGFRVKLGDKMTTCVALLSALGVDGEELCAILRRSYVV